MNALIVLAHGSRRLEANQEIVDLAHQVKTLEKNEYAIVEHAYLEIAEPTLLQCIDIVIMKGVSNITVLPYFLNSGNHVKRDIPAMIETAIQAYPDCQFHVSSFIGMYTEMPELVLKQARLS